ncbi:MAG: hypothetical protein JWO73_758 [Candidatus Taylorbacteria bacterium]|nr:hypothetical protein [Candidatus Taylorbacteria bacterium]
MIVDCVFLQISYLFSNSCVLQHYIIKSLYGQYQNGSVNVIA